jgi:hypothetical protein
MTPGAIAGLLDFNLDAEAGYGYFTQIKTGDESMILKGGTVGARAMLKILFISAVIDYQHFFNKADYLHAGLGANFGLPLGAVEPYVRGSVGVMLLDASKDAFDSSTAVDINNELGLQARAGLGLDIPLGDWFALGLVGDFGYHYITGEHGFDLSIMGYLGLRI